MQGIIEDGSRFDKFGYVGAIFLLLHLGIDIRKYKKYLLGSIICMKLGNSPNCSESKGRETMFPGGHGLREVAASLPQVRRGGVALTPAALLTKPIGYNSRGDTV
jgi:hypothetical protein